MFIDKEMKWLCYLGILKDSNMQNIMTKAPNFVTSVQSKGALSTKVIDRKIIQDTSKEIPFYPDPVYRPLLNL